MMLTIIWSCKVWKLASALANGCTVVMEMPENTPLLALFVSKLITQADCPPGAVNMLSGYVQGTGEVIVKHHGINKIAFTGSTLMAMTIQKIPC